jgi:hypothetical protein
MPHLLTLDQLVSVLSSRFETLNPEMVEIAAYELARDEAGVFMPDSAKPLFYAQPPRKDMVACVERVQTADLVVLAPSQNDTMKVNRYHYGTLMRDLLDAGFTYPWEVMGLYAVPEIADLLTDEFTGHIAHNDSVLFYKDRLLRTESLLLRLSPIIESVTASCYSEPHAYGVDNLDWPQVAGIIKEYGVSTVPHDLPELLARRLDYYEQHGTPVWQLQSILRPLFAKFLGQVLAKQPSRRV